MITLLQMDYKNYRKNEVTDDMVDRAVLHHQIVGGDVIIIHPTRPEAQKLIKERSSSDGVMMSSTVYYSQVSRKQIYLLGYFI